MNPQDLQTLLDYNYWARDRMLEALEPLTPEEFTRKLGGSFTSIRDTAVHILGAEIIWSMRLHGESPTALPLGDRFPDVGSLRRQWVTEEQKMREFLQAAGDDGINRVFDYRLLSGTPGRSPVWQTLQHLVNHGTYHRGQVTTLLRQIGAKPPQSMDLLGYYTERSEVGG